MTSIYNPTQNLESSFLKAFPQAIKGTVRFSYLGKDERGSPLYKFTYQAHRGGPMSPRYTTSTVRAVSDAYGSTHKFYLPSNYLEQQKKAADPIKPSAPVLADPFRSRRTKILSMLGEAQSKGLINDTQFRNWTKITTTTEDPGFLDAIQSSLQGAASESLGLMENRPDKGTGDDGDLLGNIDDLFSSLFSGGGSGFTGPTYVKPDERVVEDFVKGALVSLIGTVPDEMVDGLVSTYMKDHRRNFDSQNQEIDPSQSVIEQIRTTEEYREIHQLRPDSEDERNWVAQRRAAAQQGGLETDLQEDFAIEQATVGGDVEDVADAAALAQTEESGSTQGTLLEGKLKNVATYMFSGVR